MSKSMTTEVEDNATTHWRNGTTAARRRNHRLNGLMHRNHHHHHPVLKDRKRKSIELEIQQLERAMTQVEQGTHPKCLAGVHELNDVRDRRLEHAEKHYALLKQSTMVVYEYECEEADTECSINREKLKSELLDQVQTEIRQCKLQLEGETCKKKAKAKARNNSSRTTRSRGKMVDRVISSTMASSTTQSRPASANGASKPRKKSGAMFPSVRVHLMRSEIDKDIQKLHKNLQAIERQRQPADDQPFANARIYRNRLFCGVLIIEDGDEILVEYRDSSPNTMSGIVSAFTSSEVFLLQADGTYGVMDIMDLRTGRATVQLLANSSDEDEEGGGYA